MDSFKGIIHHSSFWPEQEIQVKDKRCAVVGTGASGVQLVQAWGPVAGQVKVFQRTPNMAIPMRRRQLTPEEQERKRALYPELFKLRETSFAGFLFDWREKNTFDDTPEDRHKFYEKVWQHGGFEFWLSLYKDVLFDGEANKATYDFWANKTRGRIEDPRKRGLLVPDKMPHYFGIRRPSLEENYYEQFNRSTVDLVHVGNNAIKNFDETGITLDDGTHFDFDVIAIATGFVSVSQPWPEPSGVLTASAHQDSVTGGES
jgi:cation diffusion facilitator CzcD-associated flavoprotein CzcO